VTTLAPPQDATTNTRAVERMVGVVLRGGVLTAAAVTCAGGVLFLARHGADPVAYSVFGGEPATLRSIAGIVRGALQLRGEWIIALGLLLLIATPIARVALLLVVFARERDGMYVAISAVVLAVLLAGALGAA
jgi:uncharacterized membrane protein